jgi:hypothetical protein
MKTYILKSKGNKPDLQFTMTDLIPIKQEKNYSFTELAGLINYRDYYADTFFDSSDLKSLYERPGNEGIDLFEIRDTAVIVIPGNALFPTILTEPLIK